MSGMEGFYCQTKRDIRSRGRGRYMTDPDEPVLPPYLTNSEKFFRQYGTARIPKYRYLSTPYMTKRSNYHHRNVTRVVQNRLHSEQRALVEDEDGHLWYRGELEAEQVRRGLGEENQDDYDERYRYQYGDQYHGQDLDQADSGIGTSFGEDKTGSEEMVVDAPGPVVVAKDGDGSGGENNSGKMSE